MPQALQLGRFLFTSESVAEGHPDKLCDRVADAVLDACLAQDPDSRVACKACTKSGMVMILGELVTKASVNYEQVIREAVKALGFDGDEKGLDWRTMNVINALEEQSPDLAQALGGRAASEDSTAGAQGTACGYATDESAELMPLSQLLAARLCEKLDAARRAGSLAWARPGGRAAVTLEYAEGAGGACQPARVHGVALAVPRAPGVEPERAERELLEQVVRPALPAELCDTDTHYRLMEPRGAQQAAGLSGQQAAADTYGGWAQGAPLSGQDGAQPGRAAAYGARWAARSLVAARLCRRCLVQLAYAPGEALPEVRVDSYSSGQGKTDTELAAVVLRSFDLRLASLQRDLGLKAPQFQRLAAYGHFGRPDLELAWEKPRELQ